MKILVTGFEPVWGPLNASRALVESFQSDLPDELAAVADRFSFAIVPTDSLALKMHLAGLLDRHRPHICLFTGQAAGRNRVCLERFAVNLKDFDYPDATGNRPRGELIEPGGPVAYRATLPRCGAMLERLAATGIPATFSNHAGNHLCNQILYHGLHHAACTGGVPRCGFLHVPLLPDQASGRWRDTAFMPLGMTRAGLAIVLQQLL